MSKYKLIIFDVDGVLRNGSLAGNAAMKKGFEDSGYEFNYSPKFASYIRSIKSFFSSRDAIRAFYSLSEYEYNFDEFIELENSEDKILELVEESNMKLNDEDVEKIQKIYKSSQNSEEIAKLIELLPGVEESIDLLIEKGYKIAIYTNSTSKTVYRDLKDLGLKRFELIIGDEHVKVKKPSGEGIKFIVNKLGYEKNEALYVGDTIGDILAAQDAGIDVAALLSGIGEKDDIEEKKPNYVFENISELVNFIVLSRT